MSIAKSLVVLTAASLMIACEVGRSPMEPTAASPGAPLAITAPIPDLSGTWNWTEEVIQAVPAFGATFFGIVPEGPMTHMRCTSAGVMTLVQAGPAFSGTTTQQSTCETQGGQVFSPAAFPTAFDIVDGQIHGHSFRMLFGAPADAVPAPYTGTIASIINDVAVELRATGRVISPGHPKSPLPFPPPPSPNHTVSWQAIRP